MEVALDISLGESLMGEEGNIGWDSLALAGGFGENELAALELLYHFVGLLGVFVVIDAAHWCLWVFELLFGP